MDLATLAHDPAVKEEGAWITIPHLDWRVKVRSSQSDSFQDSLNRVVRRLAVKYGRKAIPTHEMKQATWKLLIDRCLLGWDESTFTMDGQPIPYSRDNALKYILDPRWPMLGQGLDWAAARVGTPEAEQPADDFDPAEYVTGAPEETEEVDAIEDMEGNSPPASASPPRAKRSRSNASAASSPS